MPTDRLNPTLAELLDRARSAEETLIAGLSPQERKATGTPDHWSAKDLIAHLTSWHQNGVEMLDAILRGETPSQRPNIDEANARTFETNAARSWEEVMAAADAAYGRLHELLPELSEQDLLDPARFTWRKGQPLAPTLVLRLYWHPMVHIGEFYAQRRDPASAEAIRKDLLRAADEMSWVPPLRGQTLYMLANLCAALGDRPSALAALRESLALAPYLRERSQQDPGLASLRDMPEYAALYQ